MGRLIELAFAVLATLFLAPIIIICAIVVRLSLGAPTFFAQERAGLSCETFRILKFRSMVDLRDQAGNLLPDEERTPPVGRLLRRFRLDEMPQLLNVIMGEMSFIGPRPLLPHTIEGMGESGRMRCSIRPGLTGWAQVNGLLRLNNDEKLALDLWYISNRSLRLDAIILVRTVGVILFGEKKINRNSLESAGASCSSRNC